MSEQSINETVLCVDLDGTLIKTDILVESALALVKSRPQDILRLPLWLSKGKANLKQKIADAVELDVESLPYNQDFLDYLAKKKHRAANLFSRPPPTLNLPTKYPITSEYSIRLLRATRRRTSLESESWRNCKGYSRTEILIMPGMERLI